MRKITKAAEKNQERIITLILRELPLRATAAEIQAELATRGHQVNIEQCRKWRREVDHLRGVELEQLAQKLAQALPSCPKKAQIVAMAERLGHPLIPGHYKRLLPLLKAIPSLWLVPRTGDKKITLKGADNKVLERIQNMTGLSASATVSFLIRALVVNHERQRIDLGELMVVSKRLKDADLLRMSVHFERLDLTGLR